MREVRVMNWNTIQGGSPSSDGVQTMLESKTIDGAAFPNAVTEGQSIRAAGSIYGVGYSTPVTPDGVKTPLVIDDDAQVATPAALNVSGEYRLAPVTYADGDATILQTDANGFLRINVASLATMVIDDSQQVATPPMLNVGGEYRASATTYTDGDATILQSDANGNLRVSGVATDDSGQVATPPMVNVGGEYRASDTTYTDGDATILQSDVRGFVKVVAYPPTPGAGEAITPVVSPAVPTINEMVAIDPKTTEVAVQGKVVNINACTLIQITLYGRSSMNQDIGAITGAVFPNMGVNGPFMISLQPTPVGMHWDAIGAQLSYTDGGAGAPTMQTKLMQRK